MGAKSSVRDPEEDAARSYAASRVKELLQAVYFDGQRVVGPTESARDRIAKSLKVMLARLNLAISDFDVDSLGVLMTHKQKICSTKPRCGSCPLVSFCAVGRERVKRASAPVVLDLFGGVGGLGSGFRSAGFRIGLAVELDRHAAQTYRLNNPGVHVMEADVAALTSENVRSLLGSRPAVICAGPPCQSYSAAGRRVRRDPRHNLFRHILSLARGLKPDAVVIENVPGIHRKIGDKSYKEIIEVELGRQFRVESHLLRAVEYGVPQVRKRYFFFGARKGLGLLGAPTASHREKGTSGRRREAPTVDEALKGLPRRSQGQPKDWWLLPDGTLLRNVGTMAHTSRVIKKIETIEGGEGPLSYRRVSHVYANTIIAGHRALPVHPTLHSTLSVREAACIQGFPRDFVFLGPRASQPLQVANAVPPPLARAIAGQIGRALKASHRKRRQHNSRPRVKS